MKLMPINKDFKGVNTDDFIDELKRIKVTDPFNFLIFYRLGLTKLNQNRNHKTLNLLLELNSLVIKVLSYAIEYFNLEVSYLENEKALPINILKAYVELMLLANLEKYILVNMLFNKDKKKSIIDLHEQIYKVRCEDFTGIDLNTMNSLLYELNRLYNSYTKN